MSDGEEMTEAQRLELAGYIAPALRRVKHETAQRRVKLVGKDGEVTGESTLGEALKGLAKIHELEHAVADGQRPKVVLCEFCGKEVAVTGQVPPKTCRDGCDRQKTCAAEGCDAVPPKGAFLKGQVLSRHGGPWKCRSCATRASKMSMTPEQRSEVARKVQAAMTPEQRSEAARKRCAAMTPEQRSEASRKSYAAMTPEQRGELTRARKMSMTAMTPEQRSEAVRKGHSNMTAEQKAVRGAKISAALLARRKQSTTETP